VILDQLPKRVGSYSIEVELGRGASGTVYRAHGADGSQVAIKVLRTVVAPEPGNALARFEREAALQRELGALEGFVPWIASGATEDGHSYLVMPYLPGGTLRDRLSREMLSIEEVLALGQALASAMGRAHALGIVHRDLKPENVLFDTSGKPFISDMGIAKHFRSDAPDLRELATDLTKSGELRGTAAYMAPEQIQHAKIAGPASDVYALGVILYECLTRVQPFTGETLLEILIRVADGKYTPLRTLRRDTPDWLAAIVERALSHGADRRFANGAELARALETRSPGAAAPTAGARPAAAPRAPAARWIVGALLVCVAVIAFALATRRANAPGAGQPLSSVGAIVVDEPSEGAVLGEGASFSVRGRVSVPGRCELRVNDVLASSSDGKFEATLRATANLSVVTVSGRCAGGVLEPVRRHVVVRDPAVPTWYWETKTTDRPRLPLPSGVTMTKERGVYRNDQDRSLLLYVPPGVFLMGADDLSNCGPVHEVELSGYFIGKYEVTNDQYAEFVHAASYRTTAEEEKAAKSELGVAAAEQEKWTGRPLRGTWRDPHGEGRVAPGDHPVVCVSWDDAMAYVKWARLTLPTEAQWERAAAWDPVAKKARRYSWGDFVPGKGSPRVGNLGDRAFIADETFTEFDRRPSEHFSDYVDGYAFLSPVGEFPDGVAPCGAMDMTGNASEWCRDGWDASPYERLRLIDPCGRTDANEHVVRGGSFFDGPTSSLAAFRTGLPRSGYTFYIGFRVVVNHVIR
jgi:serine/threonine-protein kinase